MPHELFSENVFPWNSIITVTIGFGDVIYDMMFQVHFWNKKKHEDSLPITLPSVLHSSCLYCNYLLIK